MAHSVFNTLKTGPKSRRGIPVRRGARFRRHIRSFSVVRNDGATDVFTLHATKGWRRRRLPPPDIRAGAVGRRMTLLEVLGLALERVRRLAT